MASEHTEESEMDVEYETCFDLAKLEEAFRAEMSAFEAPCTGSEASECWIFENLTPWNNVFKEIGYAVDEYEGGKAILRPMNTFVLASTCEDFVQRGFLLFYMLLKLHHCVKALEVAGHLATIRCIHVVNAAVAECTALESLKVIVSPEDPRHGEPLVEGIQNVSTLQHVTLQGLSLSAPSAEKVAKMLASNRHLKSVILSALEADVCNMTAILDALSGLKGLTELAIANKGFNAGTAETVARLINGTAPITRLHLTDQCDLVRRDYLYDEDDLARQGDKGVAVKILCEALLTNKTVEVLNLQGSRIYDDGAANLATALKKNTTVREVVVESSDIEDKGIEALADALKLNKTLEVLNVNYNVITDVGGRSLAEALTVNRSLRRLSMYHTYFGLSTCCAFVEALDQNAVVEYVGVGDPDTENQEEESEKLLCLVRNRRIFHRMDLQWNGASLRELARALRRPEEIRGLVVHWLIDPAEEEATEVLEAICENPYVVELRIARDEFPRLAVPALVRLLKTTKTLKTIDVYVEASDAPVFDAVMDALAENATITRLVLKCCMLNEHAEQKLGEMLRRNRNICELVLDDASTEFSVNGGVPHLSLARDLESNTTLLKVTNSHAWVPQEGLFKIEEVLRRNARLMRAGVGLDARPKP